MNLLRLESKMLLNCTGHLNLAPYSGRKRSGLDVFMSCLGAASSAITRQELFNGIHRSETDAFLFPRVRPIPKINFILFYSENFQFNFFFSLRMVAILSFVSHDNFLAPDPSIQCGYRKSAKPPRTGKARAGKSPISPTLPISLM